MRVGWRVSGWVAGGVCVRAYVDMGGRMCVYIPTVSDLMHRQAHQEMQSSNMSKAVYAGVHC